jgi:hypothetical protein
MLTYVALPYQVYRLTHRRLPAFWAAEPFLCPSPPSCGPLMPSTAARWFSDGARARRKRAPALTRSLEAPPVWPLYLAAGAMSALNAQRPSLTLLTAPRIARDLPPCPCFAEVSMIAGPALAGILLASRFAATYGVDFLSYLLSLLASV